MSAAFTDLPPGALATGHPTAGGTAHAVRTSAFDWIFAEQQDLTAVDRFSRRHDRDDLPANARFYRDLIPAQTPAANQQYAFEVDLDVCTGCKACVTGCHNMNGLDEGETWRTVGLLHGGTAQAPAQQTVTTACHHCAEPACLTGCPVKAYEKDPVTGIVKHLDDQCIGCQYCVLMCPYDAPKYNSARGIVRKCDMCSDRLAHGEAPACVQSCPNKAIRIALVDRADVARVAVADTFLTGAPSAAATLPTTVYKNGRTREVANMVPGDLHSPPRQPAHPPLVVMLALTQLSVGALIVNLLVSTAFGPLGGRATSLANVLFALAFGVIAMAVMPLHLGRPQYAFRALLGLRTSWLSREILAFSMFMGLFGTLAASYFLPGFTVGGRTALAAVTALSGALGVACSVMVYVATRRAHWRLTTTGTRFALSSVILGCAAVQVVSLVITAEQTASLSLRPPAFVTSGASDLLNALLIVTVAAKLLWERSWSVSPIATREHLETARRARVWLSALGGLALPLLGMVVARIGAQSSPANFPLSVLTLTSTGSFLACLAGELCERYLFFADAPPSKMPGAFA